MEFTDFKTKLLDIVNRDEIDLRKVQALITIFYKDKAIPRLQSIQTFVVRASINEHDEVFNNVTRCSYPPDEKKSIIKIQRANSMSSSKVDYVLKERSVCLS